VGLIDIDSPFPRIGTFNRGGAKDGVDFSILDVWFSCCGISRGEGAFLHLGLRRLPEIEEKLLEISPNSPAGKVQYKISNSISLSGHMLNMLISIFAWIQM